MKCRSCGRDIESNNLVIDLGISPPANSYVDREELNSSEVNYPLRVFVCPECYLMQLEYQVPSYEIFDKSYAYASSVSESWVRHAKEFADKVCGKLGLGHGNNVLEIGSNDGYLLQWFKQNGCKVEGIDPAYRMVVRAMEKGIETYCGFFSSESVSRYERKFDLVCGINVLAHQPDIVDFVGGVSKCLKEDGVAVFEFPDVCSLMFNNLFDTIYHEHYYYLSLFSLAGVFGKAGMQVFDVERLDTHGGSYRIYAVKAGNVKFVHVNTMERLNGVYFRERQMDINDVTMYPSLAYVAGEVKRRLMKLLYNIPCDQTIVGYGAAAKAVTMVNYCGIKPDLIPAVFDKSDDKADKYMPGSRIPIIKYTRENMEAYSPDYVVIFAWNFADEIMEELGYIREWGGKFVITLPRLMIIN